MFVVDDEQDVREALIAVLEHAGYAALGAGNGEEALAMLHTGVRPDLILLDLWMPVKTGWAFRIEQMRDARLAQIPTIVLSADEGRHDITGLVAALPKPLDVTRLLDLVRTHCTGDTTQPVPAEGRAAGLFQWIPAWVFDDMIRVARDIGATVTAVEARHDELVYTLTTGASVRRVLLRHASAAGGGGN